MDTEKPKPASEIYESLGINVADIVEEIIKENRRLRKILDIRSHEKHLLRKRVIEQRHQLRWMNVRIDQWYEIAMSNLDRGQPIT